MNHTISIKRDPFGIASTGKLAMWLFLAMDAITFGVIIAGGIYLRLRTDQWPEAGQVLNIPLTSLNTFLLIMTSFTMVMGLNELKKDNQRGFKTFILLTIIGGIFFLVIQGYEYYHFVIGRTELGKALTSYGFSGISLLWTTGTFGSTFYATTSFHGLHVLAGVVYLSVILYQARTGVYTAKNYDRVEIAGLFWHFVDLVWILVFTIIYLV